jgi:hypothetical protein
VAGKLNMYQIKGCWVDDIDSLYGGQQREAAAWGKFATMSSIDYIIRRNKLTMEDVAQ